MISQQRKSSNRNRKVLATELWLPKIDAERTLNASADHSETKRVQVRRSETPSSSFLSNFCWPYRYTYTCTHTYTHTKTHKRAHTHTHRHTHIHTHIHAHAHTHTHAHSHTYTHNHRHTHTHTHTHAHTHAHTHTLLLSSLLGFTAQRKCEQMHHRVVGPTLHSLVHGLQTAYDIGPSAVRRTCVYILSMLLCTFIFDA